MVTSVITTLRLHALLGAAVVSGVWRDFVPSRLAAVFVLGEVEQRMCKVEIDSAAMTWYYRYKRAPQMTKVCVL